MLTSLRGVSAALLLTGSGLFASPALADETDPPAAVTVTGSAAVVSQYRYRGLAQSDNKPAVQGSLTVSHQSGFYLGTWASSATAGKGPIDIGGSEVDLYGGWTRPLGASGVSVDLGAYGYLYPSTSQGNYYELYGSLAKTLGPVTAKAGVYYAPSQKVFDYNWTSTARHNTYVYGELSAGIPTTPITVHSHLGHTSGGFEWGKKYIDYTVGASMKWKMLTFDVSLVGTNLSKDDIARGFDSYITAVCGAPGSASCRASEVNYWHRMNKTAVVGSLTASF